MSNKVFKKFYFTTIALVLVLILFLGITFSYSSGRFLANDKRNLLDKNCQVAADFYLDSISKKNGSPALLYSMLGICSLTSDCDMFISDANGAVVSCTCSDFKQDGYCTHSSAPIGEKIIERVKNNRKYFEIGTFDGMYRKSHYTAARPLINADGTMAGIVYASLPASDLQALYSTILRMFILASIIPACLIFVFAYATSFRLTKPLKLMSAAAKSMAKGDFSQRIPVRGNDEIAELANSFNEMTNALSQLEFMRRSFVANVSHELRTPMTTIGGFIDGILDGTIDRDHEKQYLTIVSDEVKRLTRLVQSMLSLSRLESGEQKPNFAENDLRETVLTIALSFEKKIEDKNIEIRGLDKIEKTVAQYDADLMHQIIYNLTDNAVKFTENGGYIEFALKDRKTEAAFIIRNSGKGISKDDLPHIFERFYKTDRSRSDVKESTGLGLYIVKSIIDVHCGKIVVRSKEDVFTEFEVVIPKRQNI